MRFKLTHTIFFVIQISIWIFYGIFLSYCIYSINNSDLLFGIVLSGVIIQLTIQRFILNWRKLGRPKLLDWFRLTTFIVLILNFYNIVFYLDNHDTFLVDNHVYVPTSTALEVILSILLGLLAISLGEFLAVKTNLRTKRFVPKAYSLRNTNLFVFVVIGIACLQLYIMLKGLLGYGTDLQNQDQRLGFLLQAVQIVGPLLLVLLSSFVFVYKDRRKLFVGLLVFYFTIQIIYGFLSGMKEEIIIPIILVLIPFILSGGKLPKFFIGFAVVFTILLYPVNNQYREITNNSFGRVNKSQAFVLALEQTFQTNFSELFISGSDQYGSRLSLFPMNMYAVDIEDAWTHFKNLNRYPYLPVAWFIPRAVLPDKPLSNTGTLLYEMQTGVNTASITPSTYGWAYLEGGLVPLALTFCLFGFTIELIERRLNLNRLFDFLFFSMILISLIKIESDIYFRLAGLLQTLLFTYLIYRLLILQRNSSGYE